jgi:hypothetical protein
VRNQVSNKLEAQQEGRLSGHSRSVIGDILATKRGLTFEQDKRDSKRGQLSEHLQPGVVGRSNTRKGCQLSNKQKRDSWAGTYSLLGLKIHQKNEIRFRTSTKREDKGPELALTRWSHRKFSQKVWSQYLKSWKCDKSDSWEGAFLLESSKITPMKGPKELDKGTAGKLQAKGMLKGTAYGLY